MGGHSALPARRMRGTCRAGHAGGISLERGNRAAVLFSGKQPGNEKSARHPYHRRPTDSKQQQPSLTDGTTCGFPEIHRRRCPEPKQPIPAIATPGRESAHSHGESIYARSHGSQCVQKRRQNEPADKSHSGTHDESVNRSATRNHPIRMPFRLRMPIGFVIPNRIARESLLFWHAETVLVRRGFPSRV